MCAIVGSRDTARFKELWKLNSHRGSHSHSFGQYDLDSKHIEVKRTLGALDTNELEIKPLHFGIGHCQAPTSEVSRDFIHPAELQGALLWHNGLIKSSRMPAHQWDTALILETLMKERDLSDIDGSFACVWLHQAELSIFRNELCRLFIDLKNFDLSSMPFSSGELVPPHVIWTLDFETQSLVPGKTFSTKENPYLI